jgi:chromosome partitioning protein
MRTIAVLNQKGGVGKTTSTANIAAALATFGKRVVVIDMDPQAHLTIHMGLEPELLKGGTYNVLIQDSRFEDDVMLVRPNLWILPANIHLVGAESELVSVVGREIILREALEGIQDQFDYCLIDCAPSLGLLTLNALAAAQEVLIPLQPHFLALQGFGKLLQTVELVNKRINPSLKVTGILLCMFDTRASLPNEVKSDIEQFLENARDTGSAWSQARIVPTFIRRNIKLAEAPSYGRTIFEYEPNCNGAADYLAVARFMENPDGPPATVEAETDTEVLDSTPIAHEEAPIPIEGIPPASALPVVEDPSSVPAPISDDPEAATKSPPETTDPTVEIKPPHIQEITTPQFTPYGNPFSNTSSE